MTRIDHAYRLKALHVMMKLLETLSERDEQGSMMDEFHQEWYRCIEDLAECLCAYRRLWGLKYIPSQVADIVQTTLETLVHRLEEKEASVASIELCRFGVNLSHKFKPTADIVRKIGLQSRQKAVKLPSEALEILREFELRTGQKS